MIVKQARSFILKSFQMLYGWIGSNYEVVRGCQEGICLAVLPVHRKRGNALSVALPANRKLSYSVSITKVD